jgi:hypothetical protein
MVVTWKATLSHYVEGEKPHYFQGPHRPVPGDLANTEKAYSHDRSRPKNS